MVRFLLVIILVLSFSACSKEEEKSLLVDSEISDVKNNMNLFRLAQQSDNSLLIREISEIILGKMIVVRGLEPEISNLKSSSISTLCKLLMDREYYSKSNDEAITGFVDDYLKTVKEDVMSELKRRKEVTGRNDQDCEIYFN